MALSILSRGRSKLVIVLAFAALAVLLQPTTSAHGGAVVVNRSGWITLGPAGNASAIYHQFGFVLALGDALQISYNVSQGSQDSVSFQLHDHIGNLTKIFVNVTQPELHILFNITLDGFYMPQWVNPNSHPVSLAYSMATVHPAATPIFLQAPFLLLVGAMPGVGGLIWWRTRRARKDQPNTPTPPPEH